MNKEQMGEIISVNETHIIFYNRYLNAKIQIYKEYSPRAEKFNYNIYNETIDHLDNKYWQLQTIINHNDVKIENRMFYDLIKAVFEIERYFREAKSK